MDDCQACGTGWPLWLATSYAMSDLAMAVGYSVVAFMFFQYLRPRHVAMLSRIFVMFGFVFILCGGTHFTRTLSVLFGTPPIYVLLVNMVSAVVVLTLLAIMVPLVPTIMKFPTASAMGKANNELRGEISDLLERNAKLATVDNLKAVSNIECAIKAIRNLGTLAGQAEASNMTAEQIERLRIHNQKNKEQIELNKMEIEALKDELRKKQGDTSH